MISEIKRLMEDAVAGNVFPGGVFLAAGKDGVLCHETAGRIASDSDIPVTRETVFDLASLTKPLVVAPVFMRLFQAGSLTPETSVGEIFGQEAIPSLQKITIENLLVHNSGLPAHIPYYKRLAGLPGNESAEVIKKLVLSEPLATATCTVTEYSDLGFMILGWMAEAVCGMDLAACVSEYVFRPLGINSLFFPAAEKRAPVYAATEICPWQNRLLSGEVHDDNARVAGGIMGHAGLFGTAGGVFELLAEYLEVFHGGTGKGVFQPEVVRYFLSEYGKTRRTPGFDMPSGKNSGSGHFFSAQSAGHLGFTGVSFWMDLKEKIILVLLTNRVNPSRENNLIRKFRPEIHDLAMKLIKA